jgi:alpha-tubulin suppressor-like RCC1 family protein
MAVIKCKMCGGDLNLTPDMTVAECEYCGTKQTVPTADNEKKLTLFGRANRLRLACEFDKAASIYESIVAEFPEEAEAYWGLVLCKYGIEYVDDPATGKKVPTCHRSSFDSVMDDSDFEQASENADVAARKVYREEAKAIEELRKGILEVSGKEEPYDIFICYKETDEDGQRTLDSVLAQDVYDALTGKGYRVFFSRISLEDKLGQEYEPYIFAALNSAKIMLAFGTDYEYFNAVWVKNEWSRFLKLMTKDKSKHLIPCYKGIDAYDMPKEFAKLQAQDLGKVGATQDLLRGIEKILGGKATAETTPAKETVVVQQAGGPNMQSLLKRGYMALEDSDWKQAESFANDVLNMDAECAEAYLILAMSDTHCVDMEHFKAFYIQNDLQQNKHIKRLRKFASGELSTYLESLDQEQGVYAEKKLKIQMLYQVIGLLKKRIQDEEREQQQKIAAEKAEQKRKEAAERAERERKEAAEREQAQKQLLEEKRKRLKIASGIISAGSNFTIGLKSDGTVLAVGSNKEGQCDVSSWRNIVSVSAGYCHTVGLQENGKVVAVGSNKEKQCAVSSWKNIVAVSAGYSHTVGLKLDGTVVATGNNSKGQCDVSSWHDIVAISAGAFYTVGLKSDGTVVAVGSNSSGECNVSSWYDIVAVSAGYSHTVGLKSNGTMVVVGSQNARQYNASSFYNNDIVAISASFGQTIVLKSNGKVASVGYDSGSSIRDRNPYKKCIFWEHIVAVSSGHSHAVGLKSDGTVVAVGTDIDGQCGVANWKLFSALEALRPAEAKLKATAEMAERERQRLKSEEASLKTELSTLKGLFAGIRRKQIEARLAEIESTLSKL